MNRLSLSGRIAAPICLAAIVFGVVMAVRQPTTAQDADADRIATLETQVAEITIRTETLLGHDYDIYPRLLPGPDPNGQWVGANYIYDRVHYSFDILCSIGEMGTDYVLHCTRPLPMVP